VISASKLASSRLIDHWPGLSGRRRQAADARAITGGDGSSDRGFGFCGFGDRLGVFADSIVSGFIFCRLPLAPIHARTVRVRSRVARSSSSPSQGDASSEYAAIVASRARWVLAIWQNAAAAIRALDVRLAGRSLNFIGHPNLARSWRRDRHVRTLPIATRVPRNDAVAN